MNSLLISILILFIGLILVGLPNRARKWILVVLAVSLLIFKSIEYTLYGLELMVHKIPIEYSTFTYFLFSLTVILNLKSIRPIAIFMSFLSGIGYIITFIFLSESFILHNGLEVTLRALISHSIVLYGGLLLMKDYMCTKKDESKILIFTGIYLVYTIMMNHLIAFPQEFIFIRLLLSAQLVSFVSPNGLLTSYDYLLYFLVLYLIYRFAIKIFSVINRYLYRGDLHEYTI
jgi:hypothetical protein